MTQNYEQRLSIPIKGNSKTQLFTGRGTPVCSGYNRIVLGGRGPYIELTDEQIIHPNLGGPINATHFYYTEYRIDGVKVYHQLFRVDYADYEIGKFYISPFDLYDEKGQVLIEPLRKKQK